MCVFTFVYVSPIIYVPKNYTLCRLLWPLMFGKLQRHHMIQTNSSVLGLQVIAIATSETTFGATNERTRGEPCTCGTAWGAFNWLTRHPTKRPLSGIPNLSAVGPAVLEMPNFIPIAAFGNIHVNNDECKCMCTPFTMILVTSRVHDRKCV